MWTFGESLPNGLRNRDQVDNSAKLMSRARRRIVDHHVKLGRQNHQADPREHAQDQGRRDGPRNHGPTRSRPATSWISPATSTIGPSISMPCWPIVWATMTARPAAGPLTCREQPESKPLNQATHDRGHHADSRGGFDRHARGDGNAHAQGKCHQKHHDLEAEIVRRFGIFGRSCEKRVLGIDVVSQRSMRARLNWHDERAGVRPPVFADVHGGRDARPPSPRLLHVLPNGLPRGKGHKLPRRRIELEHLARFDLVHPGVQHDAASRQPRRDRRQRP